MKLPDYLGRAGSSKKDVRGGTLSLVKGSKASFAATATRELAQAKKMLDTGNSNEASALLTKLVKDYAGTQAAPLAAGMLTTLAKTPESTKAT